MLIKMLSAIFTFLWMSFLDCCVFGIFTSFRLIIFTKWVSQQLRNFLSVPTLTISRFKSSPLLCLNKFFVCLWSGDDNATKDTHNGNCSFFNFRTTKLLAEKRSPLKECQAREKLCNSNTMFGHTCLHDYCRKCDYTHTYDTDSRTTSAQSSLSLYYSYYNSFANFEEFIAIRCLASMFSSKSRTTLRRGRYHVKSLTKLYGMSGIYSAAAVTGTVKGRDTDNKHEDNDGSDQHINSSMNSSLDASVRSVTMVFGPPETITAACALYRIGGGIYPQMYFVWFIMPEDDYNVAAGVACRIAQSVGCHAVLYNLGSCFNGERSSSEAIRDVGSGLYDALARCYSSSLSHISRRDVSGDLIQSLSSCNDLEDSITTSSEINALFSVNGTYDTLKADVRERNVSNESINEKWNTKVKQTCRSPRRKRMSPIDVIFGGMGIGASIALRLASLEVNDVLWRPLREGKYSSQHKGRGFTPCVINRDPPECGGIHIPKGEKEAREKRSRMCKTSNIIRRDTPEETRLPVFLRTSFSINSCSPDATCMDSTHTNSLSYRNGRSALNYRGTEESGGGGGPLAIVLIDPFVGWALDEGESTAAYHKAKKRRPNNDTTGSLFPSLSSLLYSCAQTLDHRLSHRLRQWFPPWNAEAYCPPLAEVYFSSSVTTDDTVESAYSEVIGGVRGSQRFTAGVIDITADSSMMMYGTHQWGDVSTKSPVVMSPVSNDTTDVLSEDFTNNYVSSEVNHRFRLDGPRQISPPHSCQLPILICVEETNMWLPQIEAFTKSINGSPSSNYNGSCTVGLRMYSLSSPTTPTSCSNSNSCYLPSSSSHYMDNTGLMSFMTDVERWLDTQVAAQRNMCNSR